MAPWAGGVYERLVSLIKSAYRKSMGRKVPNFWEISTLITEIEGMLNARPLTFVSTEPDAPRPLRPIDFLIPLANINLPVPADSEGIYKPSPAEKLSLLWSKSNQILAHFWKQWSTEYLLMLRNRTQIKHAGPHHAANYPIEIGHIVLVEEEFQPKNIWPLARVVKLNGEPGKARSADILMANKKILCRPVCKLVPLEVAPEWTETAAPDSPTSPLHQLRPKNILKRPQRYSSPTHVEVAVDGRE
jgi:hypothetical protein